MWVPIRPISIPIICNPDRLKMLKNPTMHQQQHINIDIKNMVNMQIKKQFITIFTYNKVKYLANREVL